MRFLRRKSQAERHIEVLVAELLKCVDAVLPQRRQLDLDSLALDDPIRMWARRPRRRKSFRSTPARYERGSEATAGTRRRLRANPVERALFPRDIQGQVLRLL